MVSLSLVIFVTLSLTILLFISPASSTSRRALDKPIQKSGFRITLQHRDYGKNLTKFELFERAIKRGKNRLHRLNTMAYSKAAVTTSAAAKSKVHAGSGEYLMEIAIGTPAESYSAILDTGSDLIWTQCKPCEECFDQSTPIFDPSKSSSFSEISCSNKLCSALPTYTCSKSKDACVYLYTYGDQSSTEGALATETFTFGKVSVPKIGFGCGSDNEGSGFSQGAGLVGLGRGPLSLISQMDEPKFSYCLTSIDDESSTSTLLMGSEASEQKKSEKMISTPLIKNPSYPSFYYLSLKGITVGDTKLSIDESVFTLNDADGSGGMIIDSGTTITYLEESAFDELKKEFVSQTKLPVDDSGSMGLDLCFKLPSNADSIEVPKLLFNFDGGSLDLPAENYMIADSSMGVACLAMGSSQGMSIFGNVQQQNMMVLHDLNAQTLSFMPTQCDKL